MKIDLKNYFQERDKLRTQQHVQTGPIVTLSRQLGCKANHIAIKLVNLIAGHFDLKPGKKSWKYINKEIIKDSARELDISEELLEQKIIEQKSGFKELLSAFDSHYTPTKELIDKVKEVIAYYASKGKVIIVGMGGTALTQENDRCLHVKLMAPSKWRAKRLSDEKGTTTEEAMDLIKKVDQKRIDWSEAVSGIEYEDHLFDMIFNVSTLTEDEIAKAIFELMKRRNMLE